MSVFTAHFQECSELTAKLEPLFIVVADNGLDGAPLTPEERELRKQKKAKLAEIIEKLYSEADAKYESCRTQCQLLDEKRQSLANQKADRHNEAEKNKAIFNEAESKFLRMIEIFGNLDRDIGNMQREINDLMRRKRDAEQKVSELNEWFWVPGYGIYLLARYFSDSDAQHLNSLTENFSRKRGEIDRLHDEMWNVRRDMDRNQQFMNSSLAEIDSIQQNIEAIIKEFGTVNRELSQWMQLSQNYSDLRASLDDEASDLDQIQKSLKDQPNQLANIA